MADIGVIALGDDLAAAGDVELGKMVQNAGHAGFLRSVGMTLARAAGWENSPRRTIASEGTLIRRKT